MLLFGSLIGFGVVIGLSLGIVFHQFEINDAIANLWGGVLGAGLGAAGGIVGALTIYEKQRRDQQRALLDQALLSFNTLMFHMMGWSNSCLTQRNADQEGANPGNLIRQCGQTAIALVASIAAVPGLPKRVNDTISMCAMSWRVEIETIDHRIIVLLSTQPAEQRASQWKSFQTEIDALIHQIAQRETWLREMI